MAKGKKYDFNLVLVDGSWTAEIVRKITSKKTVVSKSQAGFFIGNLDKLKQGKCDDATISARKITFDSARLPSH